MGVIFAVFWLIPKQEQIEQKQEIDKDVLDVIQEYKLIQNKTSKLSKAKRDVVKWKVKFLLRKGLISDDLININKINIDNFKPINKN